MELTPVSSSNVAAIGYLDSHRVLLVEYRDGALYARSGWTRDQYDKLCAAESKGSFLRAIAGPAVKLATGKGATETETTPTAAAGGALKAPPLFVVDPEADRCCVREIGKRADGATSDVLWCPTCGTQFNRSAVNGIVYWAIRAQFAVVSR